MMPELPFSTLAAAAKALRLRRIGALELTQLMLERIEALNPRLNAYSDVTADAALAAARRVDRARRTGKRLGPLAGIPVANKDIIDLKGARCPAGLSFLRDYRPTKDAEAIRRLKEAGAVVLGGTETDPGAFGVRTPAVTHPFAPAHTVGGSSGGSGAAVAAGLALGALGTDTGGSIRVPAACCAVAGLKPTRGRVSLEGVRPLVWSLDHVGPLAPAVADLALLQAALDPRYRPVRQVPRRPRIGLDAVWVEQCDASVRAGVLAASDAARALGARFVPVSLPSLDEVIPVHGTIFCAEAAAYHRAAFPDRQDDYPPLVRFFLSLADQATGADYVAATRQRAAFTAAVDALFERVDALLLPTLAILPPLRDAETVRIAGQDLDFTLGMVRFTCLFDHSGHPVVALPSGPRIDGRAPSVQLVGPRDGDADLVALADRLQQALGFGP
jgi:Asp-tRNA(Asn)/Glu-tRNA(Gln) amidotransferase A subunit family amidase